MKKSVIVLTAALSFGMAAAQQTSALVTPAAAQVPTLTDVSAGHWAKDAIDRLVARGILLGYPDGTFRGSQNLTRYEAAVIIARLLNQIGNGKTAGLDNETITSLQNAVQELSADLAALGVRVNDLEQNTVSKEDFSRLEDRVEALDGGSDLSGLSARYDSLSSNYDALRANVDDNASNIAALNDLTILLNQDILDLQDRASALEAAQADFVTRTDFDALSGSVRSIDGRVTALENGPKFTVGGSLDARYGSNRLTDGSQDFDLDLLNHDTFIGNFFSTDPHCSFKSGELVKYNEPGVRCTDTTKDFNKLNATVNFGVSNIKTANGAITVNSAHASLKASNMQDSNENAKAYVSLAHADMIGSANNGVKFSVNYDNGDDSNSKFKFNDYLLANDNDDDDAIYRRGVVATVDASALTAIAPRFTVAFGNAYPQYNVGPELNVAQPLQGNYFGVRMSVNPYNLGTLGISYVQGNVNGSSANTPRRDAVGLDADFKVGPATIQGVFVGSYINSMPDFSMEKTDKAGYVKFGVDVSGVKLNANYHYIDPAYEDGVASMSANDAYYYGGVGGDKSTAPFGPNESGFGADISYNFGPIGAGAYVNTFEQARTEVDPLGLKGKRQTTYGVKIGTAVLRGTSLVGFYNDAKIDGDRVTELFGNDTDENNFDGSVDGFSYSATSSYGVSFEHDGKAADALVSGLNINASYARLYDDMPNIRAYKYDDFKIHGDYNIKAGLFSLRPFGYYRYFHNPNSGQVYNGYIAGDYTDGSLIQYEGNTHEPYSFNSFKVGAQVKTDPMADVVTKPSFYGNVAYLNTKFDDDYAVNADPTTEFLGNVGITLNEFLFPTSKFSVGYSYYQGYRVPKYKDNIGIEKYYDPFDGSSDRIAYNNPDFMTNYDSDLNKTFDRSVQGVYGQWEVWGIRAAYGVYRLKNLRTDVETTAQSFKVTTKINF